MKNTPLMLMLTAAFCAILAEVGVSRSPAMPPVVAGFQPQGAPAPTRLACIDLPHVPTRDGSFEPVGAYCSTSADYRSRWYPGKAARWWVDHDGWYPTKVARAWVRAGGWFPGKRLIRWARCC